MAEQASSILSKARKYVKSYEGDDETPILIAIADPKKGVEIGLTIQRDYPLSLIERIYGIPFARHKSDASKYVAGGRLLHACKWSIDVHDAVFQVDVVNERFATGEYEERRAVTALSTGAGNIRKPGSEHSIS